MYGMRKLKKPMSSNRLRMTGSAHCGRTTGALGLSLRACSCPRKVCQSFGACSPSMRIQSNPAYPRISVVMLLASDAQHPMSVFPAHRSRRNELGIATYGVVMASSPNSRGLGSPSQPEGIDDRGRDGEPSGDECEPAEERACSL